MKNVIIAALASLMMAGVLAGASEPVSKIATSGVFTLDQRSPILLNAPMLASCGDSMGQ